MRTLACFCGFVVFGLVLFFVIGDVLVDRAWFRALGPWAWPAAVGLIVADVFVPIPTTVVITAMGQMYGPLLGAAIGIAGSFLAGVVAYGLTRMLGRRFAHWLLADELEAVETQFARNGPFVVACSRWLPLLPEAISCIAGLARMPFGKYCLALLCGAVPMSFAYAALATVSRNDLVPLVISILMPLPIWWIAGRLLYHRTGNGKNRN